MGSLFNNPDQQLRKGFLMPDIRGLLGVTAFETLVLMPRGNHTPYPSMTKFLFVADRDEYRKPEPVKV